jgi:DnaK suppressor protein
MQNLTLKFVSAQKAKLNSMRENILEQIKNNPIEAMNATEKVSEEGDLAQKIIDQQRNLNFRQKEISTLRNIESALNRITEGSYGFCEESGELIEQKRLEKIPWATLTIIEAEQKEREANLRYKKH